MRCTIMFENIECTEFIAQHGYTVVTVMTMQKLMRIIPMILPMPAEELHHHAISKSRSPRADKMRSGGSRVL